ncbi:MAG TPA: hypothetical protein QGI07_06930 [Dehalococcoidia bacterium]|jgi:hypothetical protein|nr:hypothetical protein [Dehalococcoidia bacterium]MDP7212284.1 hypothetical protein [Dehalococcoidia bacterium]MDP7515454.1 hypothetical protein [Dehalococcoidia bacterium]HJM53740.1 hypothetical protein [Dehalococcoidia bacterium]
MSADETPSDSVGLVHGGFTLKTGKGSASMAMECPHQNGLLYMVPGDRSWVCEDDVRPAHVLAGFFKEISGLDDARIREAMNRWGLYYRPRSLSDGDAGTEDG